MQEFAYWQNMPKLQKQLEKVQQIILNNVRPAKGQLGKALKYNFAIPGKELRPAFVILFGQMGQNKREKALLNIASSVEILHNATLIHDDIIDESSTRRGRSSIQAKFGKHIALYAGDYLFALSLQLLSNNTSKINNMRIDAHAMQEILSGETAQYGNEYNTNISEKEYLEQIKGKTSILFGYSCFIGAIEGGLSYTLSKKAQRVGILIGEAFQLRDDILDYTASSNQFKKPVLLDVVNGVYTGPLIFALKNDPSHELIKLVKVGKKLTPEQLKQIDRLVAKLGGIKYAQGLADNFTKEAINILNKEFKGYISTPTIISLVKRMLKREY